MNYALLSNVVTGADGIYTTVSQTFGDWVKSGLVELGIWAWEWFNALSFWGACIGSMVLIILYGATKDDKYFKKVLVIFILYFFLRGLNGAL